MIRAIARVSLGLVLLSGFATRGLSQEKPSSIALAGGKLKLQAPEKWTRKQPASPIVEHEFAIPAAEGDKSGGRLTVMGAGGGIDANIQRWYGQFTQPDGSSTKDRAKVKQVKIDGEDVHLVDVSGTYTDMSRGQAGPPLPKYRMLAAIVATKGDGNYFIKFYGPERTVTENEKAFNTMIEGLAHK